jgi:hypothetical protein
MLVPAEAQVLRRVLTLRGHCGDAPGAPAGDTGCAESLAAAGARAGLTCGTRAGKNSSGRIVARSGTVARGTGRSTIADTDTALIAAAALAMTRRANRGVMAMFLTRELDHSAAR